MKLICAIETFELNFGEMAEWTKARDSKSRVAARQPGVQIPLSPIFLQASGNTRIGSCGKKCIAFFPLSPRLPRFAWHTLRVGRKIN